MDSPDSASRRQFLSRSAAVLGLAATTSLAGCRSSEETGGSAGGGTPAGLRLETLAVGGSPGEETVVDPPGEVALLDFFATWCAPCKPQMAELRTVREQFPDLHMLSLTREEDADLVRSFWREFEGTWPVAQDSRLRAFRGYNVTGIPTLLVVDAGGTEAWRHTGLANAETIASELREARA